MTTAIATVQQARAKGGVKRFPRRLEMVLAALGDRIAAWSAPYHENGLGEELAATPPSQRIDAALRWHARRARSL